MKTAIVGSRGFVDAQKFSAALSKSPLKEIMSTTTTIISGGAKGTDTLAKEYALSHSISLKEILPDYSRYPGKVAPIVRNKEIVELCDCLVAFWDGTSPGTKMIVDYGFEKNKVVVLIRV